MNGYIEGALYKCPATLHSVYLFLVAGSTIPERSVRIQRGSWARRSGDRRNTARQTPSLGEDAGQGWGPTVLSIHLTSFICAV